MESKAKPKRKKANEKRAKKITSKKKKKVKEYDSDTMIERLKQRGVF